MSAERKHFAAVMRLAFTICAKKKNRRVPARYLIEAIQRDPGNLKPHNMI